ncbi:DUF3489 domain-containing protein [Rhodovulum sp. DZ06]|uniref:DUF3489 domain-containing protein n=1 Tax=Rhodovulum sp. DZ06 TaxID=3425126 RepID=UPI003D33CFAE
MSGRAPRPGSKRAAVLDLLRRPGGAAAAELAAATGWSEATVRGFLSRDVRGRLALPLSAERPARGAPVRYRISS